MAGEEPVPAEERTTEAADDPWELNEIVRRRRLREQGERTPAENLEEAFALISFASRFVGAARQ